MELNVTVHSGGFPALSNTVPHVPRRRRPKHRGQANNVSLGRVDLCCIAGSPDTTMPCNCAVCQEKDDHSHFWVGITNFVSIHSKSSQVGGRWWMISVWRLVVGVDEGEVLGCAHCVFFDHQRDRH